jgi:hypothetical protein
MLRQRGILHALADFKTLRLLAFDLGDGFVNVGGHGGGHLSRQNSFSTAVAPRFTSQPIDFRLVVFMGGLS